MNQPNRLPAVARVLLGVHRQISSPTGRPSDPTCDRRRVYIDPPQPRARAIITHGHADHARSRPWRGAGDARHHRDHEDALWRGLRRAVRGRCDFGEPLTDRRRHHHAPPAGHILGSAQVLLEYSGQRDRRHRRLQAPRRPHGAAVRAGRMRPAGHRGDLWAAGVPASAIRRRNRRGC